ncbi:MAG: hypothetical protein GC139_07190 [Sideroxydans sp.]|nr:hypothetical protein [Sideroxydans sp.]
MFRLILRNTKNLRPVFLMLALTLSGCAGGPFKAADKQATVYIYRSPGGVPGPYPKTLFIDGKAVGSLVSDGYFRVQLDQGEHVFATPAANKAELTLYLAKGVTYYVSQEIIPARPPFVLINRVKESIGKPYIAQGRRLY